jgi:hypothetical protein
VPNGKRMRPDHRPTQKAISGRREIESVYFVVDYRFPMALTGCRARFGDVFSQLRRMQMRNETRGRAHAAQAANEHKSDKPTGECKFNCTSRAAIKKKERACKT